MKIAKNHTFIYILAFILATVSLKLYGGASDSFLLVMLVLGLVWLFKSYKGFSAPNDQKWARNMFFFSLIVILGLSIMLAFDPVLP
jgi:protoheme IX farnesyltransferase